MSLKRYLHEQQPYINEGEDQTYYSPETKAGRDG